MHQVYAIFALAGICYLAYLVWNFLVLLVIAPRGSLIEALASAEIDEAEEERQRRRRLRWPEDDELGM